MVGAGTALDAQTKCILLSRATIALDEVLCHSPEFAAVAGEMRESGCQVVVSLESDGICLRISKISTLERETAFPEPSPAAEAPEEVKCKFTFRFLVTGDSSSTLCWG